MIRYSNSIATQSNYTTKPLAMCIVWMVIGLFSVANSLPAHCQQPPTSEKDPSSSIDETVIAYVGDEPIRLCDIRYQDRGQASIRKQKSPEETVEPREADLGSRSKRDRAVVELIRDRMQVQSYLDDKKLSATEAEVSSAIDEALERISSRTEGSQNTKGELTKIACEQVRLPLESWKRELRWQLSWKRYIQEAITDQDIEKYFESHRAQFDGTRLEVAHILRLAAVEDRAGREKQIQKLVALRKSILDKTTSFEEAAKENSQGVTAATNGGVVGWIAWDGPMSRRFTQAAFALQENEISEPVESEFGVHLIKILKKDPGKLTFQQCYSVAREAFLADAFFRLVSESQPIAIRWETDVAK